MRIVHKIPSLKQRKTVMIGIGAGDGTLEALCTASLYSASPLLWAAGVSVELCIESGNCHVDDMRNAIVAQFMQSECEELVFIDEDVSFTAETLLRLIELDRDVIGGIYPRKQEEIDYPVFLLPGTELWAEEDGTVEVHGLPTGFLKIKRHVLEKLWAVSKKWTGSDEVEYREIFARGFYEGARKSGDYAFCYKWRALGGKLYTDPEMTFGHTGKKTWFGSVGPFWKKKHGVSGDTLASAVERIKSGDHSDEAIGLLAEGWGNSPWAASTEFLGAIRDKARGHVTECGSGASTLLLAAMGLDVTVLEHDEDHAARVRWYLDKFGLDASLQCKPLKNGWYDFEGGECDTLVIDGPPRQISDRSIAVERVKAPLVIWDDYSSGLDDPQIMGSAKQFAVKESTPCN